MSTSLRYEYQYHAKISSKCKSETMLNSCLPSKQLRKVNDQ